MSDAQLEAAERYEYNKDKIEMSAVTYLMANTHGRSWVYDLLEEWGAFGTPFSKESSEITGYYCGMHASAMHILNAITEHAPENYIRMLKERKALNEQLRRNDEQRRFNADDNGTGH